MSQTSIADSTARQLAASAAGALPRRVLRAATCGSICWLIQAAPAAFDPGLGLLGSGLIRPGLVLASYAAALLASMVLGLRRDDIVRTRPAKAAWVGVAFALDHLILLAALPGGAGLREGAWTAIAWPDLAWIWIALSVAVATATLAALAWGTALGVDRWGRICMIAVSLTGLALMHLTGRAALYGSAPMAPCRRGGALVRQPGVVAGHPARRSVIDRESPVDRDSRALPRDCRSAADSDRADRPG
ncbi:MAG: hypothetical protein WDN69_08315 [Aliidongia sp.]